MKGEVLKDGTIAGVKTAFMEYTEPSIATRLKEFDTEGFSDVIVVPIFLTVSPHTFEDIPAIMGRKEDPQSLETLKMTGIERYKPQAKTHQTPELDFPGILKNNILRRAKALSVDPANEGLVLIAYGDTVYEKEWATLLQDVGQHVQAKLGIQAYSHGWCGHIADYNPDKTTEAVQKVLNQKKKALVIPVLMAHDETFQIKIIGGGIAKIPQSSERVAYRPDSILPDKEVDDWVLGIVRQTVKGLTPEEGHGGS